MQSKQTEALKKVLTELCWYEEAGLGRISTCDAIHTAREALAEQPAPVQEPVTVKLKDDWRTDDWGKPIIYDTVEVDEVTGALTGDEGEEDSLTVLNSMVRYVSNVWPGKTALQVLIECEEAMIATPPSAPEKGQS